MTEINPDHLDDPSNLEDFDVLTEAKNEIPDESDSIHLCDVCATDANHWAVFTLDEIDDKLIDQLDLAMGWEFYEADNAEVRICPDCFLDGPGYTFRQIDTVLTEFINVDMGKQTMRRQRLRLALLAIGCLLLVSLIAYFYGPLVIGGVIFGIIIGGACIRVLWLDAGLAIYDQ